MTAAIVETCPWDNPSLLFSLTNQTLSGFFTQPDAVLAKTLLPLHFLPVEIGKREETTTPDRDLLCAPLFLKLLPISRLWEGAGRGDYV